MPSSIEVSLLAIALSACGRGAGSRTRLEVVVNAPGSVAEVVATVTVPLERALASVPHVTHLTSRTRAGEADVQLELEGSDVAAIMHAAPPGAVARRTPRIARYVIADPKLTAEQLTDAARRLVDAIAHADGVASVVTCGEVRPVVWIDVDPAHLGPYGLAVDDIVRAIAAATPHDLEAVMAVAISTPPQAQVRLGDVARLSRGIVPGRCHAAGASGPVIALDVYASPTADDAAVRGAVAARVGTLAPQPSGRHIVVGTDPGREPARSAVGMLRDAAVAGGLGDVVVEAGGDGGDVTIDGTGSAGLDAIRALPFVVGAGEVAFAIRLGGEDAAVADAGRRLAERFVARHELIATRGLAKQVAVDYVVDPHAVDALGATGVDVAIASEAPDGVRAGELVVDGHTLDLRVRVTAIGTATVHGRAGIVPLGAVAAIRSSTQPNEILRANGRREVEIDVRSTPDVARAELAAAKFPPTITTAVEAR